MCRAIASAVVLASSAMLSPSTTIAAAAGRSRPSRSLDPLADVERPLRRPVRRPRAPPWVRTSRPLPLEGREVLADRHPRHGEPRREVGYPGAAVLLDDAGDVLLALFGEDVARARGRSSQASLTAVDCRTLGCGVVTVRNRIRNVNKAIEIKRNLCQARRSPRTLLGAGLHRGPRHDPAGRARGASPPHVDAAAGRVGTIGPRQPTTISHDVTAAGPDRRATEADVTSDPDVVATLRVAADRAAVVGVRQLRHAVQGLRPEGRPSRPVREDRRRRPGQPLHRRRADGRAPHPVGQGRRLRGPRPPRRATAASPSGRSTRTRSRTTTTCSAASATPTRASAGRPSTTSSSASTSWTRPARAT